MFLPLYCLSLALLALAPQGGSIILIAAGVFQGFYTLSFVTSNAMRAEIMPISLLGSWGGLLGLFSGIVGIIVPVSAGFIWSIISPVSVLMLLIVSVAIGGAVLTTMPETLKMAREL